MLVYILQISRDLQGSCHDSAASGHPRADLRFRAGLRAVQSPQRLLLRVIGDPKAMLEPNRMAKACHLRPGLPWNTIPKLDKTLMNIQLHPPSPISPIYFAYQFSQTTFGSTLLITYQCPTALRI